VPADLPRFRRLAEAYGFFLIEDAAHGIGSTYTFEGKTYACGSCAHTDLAIFSFHPVKTITTGEGGAVLTNRDELAQKVRRLSSHGIERDPESFINKDLAFSVQEESTVGEKQLNPWYHEMHDLGFNSRSTDLQCALGLSQLKRLDYFKSRRQEIFKAYTDAFSDLGAKKVVVLPPWPEETDPCFHLFPLRLGTESCVKRDDLFRSLRGRNINCQVHYIPIYRQPYYKVEFEQKTQLFPEAENYFWNCLSLPLYPGLGPSEHSKVCEQIRTCLKV
jgi:dTDP-4-amino-4,6-dideoxygalactose transaminase